MLLSANRKFYESPLIGEMSENALFRAEEIILVSLRDELRNHPVLEIGVGSGRVTEYLRPISKDYIGIDYSERMINVCRERNPDARLIACDATNMPMFTDEQFAAVFFFWNGIDEVTSSDRLLILKEVNRVLKRKGIFVFSSHNLDWESIPSYLLDTFTFPRNPVAFIRNNMLALRSYASTLFKHLVNKIYDRGYLVITEYEESPSMLIPRYFIKKEAQVRQLSDAGFCQVEALAGDGSPLDEKNRSKDHLVYYIARKS
jgi:ubiquinone/menaquinone biosynthesis C-methylase UbiE